MKKVLRNIVKKHILYIILISALLIIIQGNRFFPAKIIGKIIDLYPNASESMPKIVKWFIIFWISIASYFVTRTLYTFFIKKYVYVVEKEIQDAIFSRFLKLKIIEMQKIKNGELMSYLTKYVKDIKNGFKSFILHFLRLIIVLVILSIYMFQINMKLTGLIFLPIIIDGLIIFILTEKIKKIYDKSQKNYTDLSEFVQESTDSIRTTKSFNGENKNIVKFEEKSKNLKIENIKLSKYRMLLYISVQICFAFCYGITAIYGTRLIIQNTITVGEFIVFNGYILEMIWPLIWLSKLFENIKTVKVAISKLEGLYSLQIEELPETKQLIQGDIKIQKLNFNFDESNEKEILKNINLSIKSGEKLGIIGTIGSGKTTLANILLKLYDIKDNQIYIDNKDINKLNTSELRDSFCYITQESFLFSSTIKNNVTLFNNAFTNEEVWRSIEYACLDEEVKNMENGIETLIGEKGITLSGGQRQRIAIARAFLYNQIFTIFDDSFSAIDNKTEKVVLNNIKDFFKNKTCIIISNRISDVKIADKIIVLENGQIVQEGTHEKLLRENGLYKNFYIQQSSNAYLIENQ